MNTLQPFNSDSQPPRERHYTVQQVAAWLNLSPDTVRRIFAEEPGVKVITNPKPQKRRWRMLRIPESVAARVNSRLSNRGRK